MLGTGANSLTFKSHFIAVRTVLSTRYLRVMLDPKFVSISKRNDGPADIYYMSYNIQCSHVSLPIDRPHITLHYKICIPDWDTLWLCKSEMCMLLTPREVMSSFSPWGEWNLELDSHCEFHLILRRLRFAATRHCQPYMYPDMNGGEVDYPVQEVSMPAVPLHLTWNGWCKFD